MTTLELTFVTVANCRAFCTWFARCLGAARLEATSDPRCVRVAFPTQFTRTVITVARHNCAITEKVIEKAA
jgi:hypothetical protein